MLHVFECGGVDIAQVAVKVMRVEPVLLAYCGMPSQGNPPYGSLRTLTLTSLPTTPCWFLRFSGVTASPRMRSASAHSTVSSVGGHHLEVVGEIEPGRTVEDAAVRLHQPDELHLAEVLRALEHHVLEEVREAGAVLGLDAESDVVVDGDDDGGAVVSRERTTRSPFGSL